MEDRGFSHFSPMLVMPAPSSLKVSVTLHFSSPKLNLLTPSQVLLELRWKWAAQHSEGAFHAPTEKLVTPKDPLVNDVKGGATSRKLPSLGLQSPTGIHTETDPVFQTLFRSCSVQCFCEGKEIKSRSGRWEWEGGGQEMLYI